MDFNHGLVATDSEEYLETLKDVDARIVSELSDYSSSQEMARNKEEFDKEFIEESIKKLSELGIVRNTLQIDGTLKYDLDEEAYSSFMSDGIQEVADPKTRSTQVSETRPVAETVDQTAPGQGSNAESASEGPESGEKVLEESKTDLEQEISEKLLEEDTGEACEDQGLGLDEMFEMLSVGRRRTVLRYLKNTSEDELPVRLRELAQIVAAQENEMDAPELDSNEYKNARVGLYQTHLDNMDEKGIIEYDKDRNIVDTPSDEEHYEDFERITRLLHDEVLPDNQRADEEYFDEIFGSEDGLEDYESQWSAEISERFRGMGDYFSGLVGALPSVELNLEINFLYREEE